MLHFHRTEIEGAKELLLEYLEAGDYSRPFILFGRCYIGKSAMIEQVKAESNISFDSFAMGPDDDIEMDDFVAPHIAETSPRVLEVSGGAESHLRNVVKNGCHVVYVNDKVYPLHIFLDPLKDKLRVDTKAIADYDGDNWEELAKLIYDCADLILYIFLFKEEACPAANALFDAMNAQ